tara:strand:+ start:844 stop:2214 length:1371 start_codon:yes stop_codon:yes gene_type:complete
MQISSKGLVLYELNEVPRRLIDLYVNKRPNSTIAKIAKSSSIVNTYSNDIGELHPWTTWPTVHRGVTNKIHKIQFINQDLTFASKWPPIWEILAKKGIPIGVFGSLQSYPPLNNDKTLFYLPDTFAPSPDAIPTSLEKFQSLNLNLSKKNKAISRSFTVKDIFQFVTLILGRSVSLHSLYLITKHLFSELLDSRNKTRRSLMQPVIGFDLYMKLLELHRPQFSTFFTNHVAGMMHRYWKYSFPEDFNIKSSQLDSFHSSSIISALDIADKQLKRLLKFTQSSGYDLWILSSMGQEAVDRGEYYPEIYVKSINKITTKLGLEPTFYNLLPAMQPDICIECSDKHSLNLLVSSVTRFKDSLGKSILNPRYMNDGLKINISIKSSKVLSNDKTVYLEESSFSLDELDLELIVRDIGTAYHIPEGILLYDGCLSKTFLSKYSDTTLYTENIASIILKFFD